MTNRCRRLCVVLAAAAVSTVAAHAGTTFDFDSGTPVLQVGQNVPLPQTKDALTAHFSSPDGAAFSVQDYGSTFYNLSTFSGKYLMANDQSRSALDIAFSGPAMSITVTFATIEYHDPGQGTPSDIQLTAYVDSVLNPPVGTVTTHGAFIPGDTFPQGSITLDRTSAPFNVVRLVVPAQPQGASGLLVDEVIVQVAVASGAGAVPDGASVPGVPLVIAKNADGTLHLSWSASCRTTDVDYAVYEGWITNYPSHVPALCSTAGATFATVYPSDGSTYYLVVPNDGTNEGSYGKDSRRVERPASTSACRPQQYAGCP